jgi:hypothetical protein
MISKSTISDPNSPLRFMCRQFSGKRVAGIHNVYLGIVELIDKQKASEKDDWVRADT